MFVPSLGIGALWDCVEVYEHHLTHLPASLVLPVTSLAAFIDTSTVLKKYLRT